MHRWHSKAKDKFLDKLGVGIYLSKKLKENIKEEDWQILADDWRKTLSDWQVEHNIPKKKIKKVQKEIKQKISGWRDF